MARNKDAEPKDRGDRRSRTLLFAALAMPLLIGFYALLLFWSTPRSPGDELRLDQFFVMLDQGRIRDTTILEVDNQVVGAYDRGRYWVPFVGGRETLFSRIITAVDEAGVPLSVEQQPIKRLIFPVTLILPALIIVDGLIIVFLVFGRGTGGIFSFGKANARRFVRDESRITFSDVAGLDEAIEELAEVRDYLANPDRFLAMGAAVPKGILLTGPPGCGKTLLARAVAGESEVPFFSVSGAEFVEMFVGVGAARIRDIFGQVAQSAPAIMFIDELDALGRSRVTTAIGGQDEREATLNQLLVEMDGFESGSGVVVLAATNRVDILDPALLRPGRFDRRIGITLPDIGGREGILRIHSRGKPVAEDVDYEKVARRTAGFSGADLANVINEAALLAARYGAEEISEDLIASAIERVIAGPEKKSKLLTMDERRRIAIHECGHAIVAKALDLGYSVEKISIVSRGHLGGFTMFASEREVSLATRSELLGAMAALLAGKAAEESILGEMSSASADDLTRAFRIGRQMVASYGMSEQLGPVSAQALAQISMEGSGPPASASLIDKVDVAVLEFLERAGRMAAEILDGNADLLLEMSGRLVEQEILEARDLEEFLQQVVGGGPEGAGAPLP